MLFECNAKMKSHKSDDFEVFSLLIHKLLVPIVKENKLFHSILVYLIMSSKVF